MRGKTLWVSLILLAGVYGAGADTASIVAVADTTIYAENSGLSNGTGDFLFSGRTAGINGTTFRRALIQFNVAGALPSGATVTNATLRLRMNRTISGNHSVSLHRVTRDWGEGTSNASGLEGEGIAATPGDATWSHANFNTISWTTAGGDFTPLASATLSVGGVGSYTWTSAQLATDVQNMLDTPGSDFGWILIGNEATTSAKRFDARDSASSSFRPTLIVAYTLPALPMSVTNTRPANAQNNVARNTDVTVEVDATLNSNSVDLASFKVSGSQSGFRQGNFSFAPITFSTADFYPGERVQVILTSNIVSDAGGALIPHVFQFRAAAGGCGDFLLGTVQTGAQFNAFDVGLGDLDGDGDLDAFVVNNGAGDGIWTNNGTGFFFNSGQSLGSDQSLKVALGDLDDDGDLDAFVAADSGPNRVWSNNGAAVFSDTGQALGNSRSFGVALCDLDGDGDLDAFVSNNGQGDKVWLNDGKGQFSDSGQLLGSSASRHVGLADIDNDGDLDALVAVKDGGDRVWTNNGAAVFGLSQIIATNASFGVALGDLDDDGDLDAVMAEVDGGGNIVYTNNGGGLFSDSGQRLGSGVTRAVEIGDVDGDGDLDLFFIDSDTGGCEIWTNNGAAIFSDSGKDFGSKGHRDIALGDVDGDGDLDAFLVNGASPHQILFNFHCGESDDFDHDGIPTDVEIANALNPAYAADGAQDADLDSVSNFREFVANTGINDSNSFFRISDFAQGQVTSEVAFASSSIRLYTLQANHDLVTGVWQNVQGAVDLPGTDTLLRIGTENTQGQLSFRVEVKLPVDP